MIRRRELQNATPPLDPAEVAIVLGGWLARPRDGAGDTGAALDLFQANVAGVVRLWRAHEPWLRNEARRLGIAPAFGSRGQWFFGEYLARGRS